MGAALSLLGALAGAALWVGITSLPIPLFLAGLAAAGVGLGAGYGMRWGGKGKASRAVAAALSIPGVLLGSYGSFVLHVAQFKTDAGTWKAPAFLEADTMRYFATSRVLGFLPLLCAAVAIWFAWRSAKE